MSWSRRFGIGLMLFFLLLLHGIVARADIGPKPSMEMRLIFSGPPIAITSVALQECDDAGCKPLQRGGPQGINCTVDSCFSRAYSYSSRQKLVITFVDRVRESNLFTKRAFDARYTVTVTETGLAVEEDLPAAFLDFAQNGDRQNLIPSLLSTILIETLVAGLYLLIFRQPKRVLLWVPVVNLISLPLVWWFVTSPVFISDANGLLKLPIAELATILVEAGLLYLLSRKALPLGRAVTLSIIMNLLSFLVGFFVSAL